MNVHGEARQTVGQVKLTFKIHRIVEALFSIIPVGVISPSFAASSLLPLIASLLILIKFSIIEAEDSMPRAATVQRAAYLNSINPLISEFQTLH